MGENKNNHKCSILRGVVLGTLLFGVVGLMLLIYPPDSNQEPARG